MKRLALNLTGMKANLAHQSKVDTRSGKLNGPILAANSSRKRESIRDEHRLRKLSMKKIRISIARQRLWQTKTNLGLELTSTV